MYTPVILYTLVPGELCFHTIAYGVIIEMTLRTTQISSVDLTETYVLCLCQNAQKHQLAAT